MHKCFEGGRYFGYKIVGCAKNVNFCQDFLFDNTTTQGSLFLKELASCSKTQLIFVLQKSWNGLKQKQHMHSGVLLKLFCFRTFLRHLNFIYCKIRILLKFPSEIYFQFKISCSKNNWYHYLGQLETLNKKKAKPQKPPAVTEVHKEMIYLKFGQLLMSCFRRLHNCHGKWPVKPLQAAGHAGQRGRAAALRAACLNY